IHNVYAVYFHVAGIFAQSRTATIRANGTTAVTAHHYAVLNFIALRFYVLEKRVEAFEIFVAGPEQLLFFFGKFVVWPVDRKIETNTVFDKRLLKFLVHFIASPRSNRTFVNR